MNINPPQVSEVARCRLWGMTARETRQGRALSANTASSASVGTVVQLVPLCRPAVS